MTEKDIAKKRKTVNFSMHRRYAENTLKTKFAQQNPAKNDILNTVDIFIE